MRTRATMLLTWLTIGLPCTAFAQFEGVVVLSMFGGRGQGQDVTQSIKAGQVRMDMGDDAGGMSMIMDVKTGTMTTLMHPQKMYMTMNPAAMAEQMKAMGRGAMPGAAPATPPKISKTGQSETIAGYKCDHYVLTGERGDTDMCIAKGMGMLTMGPTGGGPFGMGRGSMPQLPPGFDQLAAEFKDGAFPLKVETVDAAKRTLVMMVKSITPKSLDTSLFQVPPDYKAFQMPHMPRR